MLVVSSTGWLNFELLLRTIFWTEQSTVVQSRKDGSFMKRGIVSGSAPPTLVRTVDTAPYITRRKKNLGELKGAYCPYLSNLNSWDLEFYEMMSSLTENMLIPELEMKGSYSHSGSAAKFRWPSETRRTRSYS